MNQECCELAGDESLSCTTCLLVFDWRSLIYRYGLGQFILSLFRVDRWQDTVPGFDHLSQALVGSLDLRLVAEVGGGAISHFQERRPRSR
jgi:hypothetical protein